MKLKELTIFDKDAPEIDKITDQEGDRWLITIFSKEGEVIELEEFDDNSSVVLQNIDYYGKFTLKADDEVTIDKWGSLVLEDEDSRFMLDFYPAINSINLVPQTK
jgi:hypothetical protein